MQNHSIPNHEIQLLEQRIEFLEHLMNNETTTISSNPPTIHEEFHLVQKAVDGLFEKHDPVINMNRQLYDLGLWKHLELLSNDETNSPNNSLSLDEKKLIIEASNQDIQNISLNSWKILEKFPNPEQLMPLINHLEKLPNLLKNVNELIEISNNLGVRTAQALKYYMREVVRENEQWKEWEELMREK